MYFENTKVLDAPYIRSYLLIYVMQVCVKYEEVFVLNVNLSAEDSGYQLVVQKFGMWKFERKLLNVEMSIN